MECICSTKGYVLQKYRDFKNLFESERYFEFVDIKCFRDYLVELRLGTPLCRYTGVTRKVPFKLRPKDRKKRCPMGTENVSCPEGKQKPRRNRGRQSSYFPSETETDCV